MKATVIRRIARVWSAPLIVLTFLLAAVPFNPGSSRFSVPANRILLALWSPYAMAFAVAFLVAWRSERVGGWIAMALAVALKVWFSIRRGHLVVGAFDLLFWPPAILFLLASYLDGGSAPMPTQTAEATAGRSFAKPRWSFILSATGFFGFMKQYWMRVNSLGLGHDFSASLSDPICASCLIGAFGSLVLGLVLKLVAIIKNNPGKSTGWKILSATSLIVRWTWRLISIVPFLFLGAFLLAGGIPKTLMHPSEWGLGDIVATVGTLLVLTVLGLSWRWEWLGGTLVFLIAGIPTLIDLCKGNRGELPECFISALSMLMLLSWSLNTLKDANAKPVLPRIALVILPLLLIALGFLVYRMPGARFNP